MFSSPSEHDQHDNIQHFRNIHAKQTILQLEQYTNNIENKIKCLRKESTSRYDHVNAKFTKIGAKTQKLWIKRGFL